MPNTDWHDQLLREMQEINDAPALFHGVRLWWKERKVKYNLKDIEFAQQFINAKAALMTANHNIEELKTNLERQSKLNEIDFEQKINLSLLVIEEQRCHQQLLQSATELGMTIQDYSEVSKQRALVDIEVDKHRQMKEIDQEYLVREINARVEGALKLQLLSAEQGMIILTKLSFLKDELYRLRYSGAPIQLITDKERDYVVLIQGMEAKLGRLLQADSRQDAGGGDADSILGGFTEPDNPEGKEQASN